MSKIPHYYNNFKKDDEGEPEDMVNLRGLFLGLVGLVGATQGAMTQQPPVNIAGFQKARLQIMKADILGGEALENTKAYIEALENTLAKTKKEEINTAAKEADAKSKEADAKLQDAKKALEKAEKEKAAAKKLKDKTETAAGFGIGYALASMWDDL